MAVLSEPITITAELDPQVTLKGSFSGVLSLHGSLTAPSSAPVPTYTGAYEVTPLAHSAVVLETEGLKMTDDVTVFKIPYYDTSNPYGTTVYIAEDINDGN